MPPGLNFDAKRSGILNRSSRPSFNASVLALKDGLLLLLSKIIDVLQLKYLNLDGKIIFSDYKMNDVIDTQRFYGGYDGENGFGCDPCRGET